MHSSLNICFTKKFHAQHGDVVGLLRAFCVSIYVLSHIGEDFLHGKADAHVVYCFFQPIFRIKVIFAVHSLRHSVRVEKEHIAGREGKAVRLVHSLLVHAEHHVRLLLGQIAEFAVFA